MRLLKLSFSQNKSRFFFMLIALMIAGIALTFSLFYTSSIEQNLAKSLPLKEDELHLFVNEEIYKEEQINFYEKLKEEFEVVIPFVNTTAVYNDEIYGIIGTDISGGKIFIDNSFIDFEITEKLEPISDHPQAYLHEGEKSGLEGNLIQIEHRDFEVIGYYRLVSDDEEYQKYIILSLEDYAKGIDTSVIYENSITKYIISDYYIKTSIDEDSAIEKIIAVYEKPEIRYFVKTHQALLKTEMNQFMLFESIPTIFFIFVSIFSIINVIITINLAIREKRKYYTILTILGMKIRHLRLMLLIEVSIISLIAALGAFLLGFGTSIIVIAFSKELIFSWARPELLLIVILTLVFLPIIQTLISVQSIKYKHIIN